MKNPVVSILIGADTRKLKRDMKQADGIVGKFTTAAKYGLASAAAAAGAFAFKLGKDGVEAAIADEASQVKLANALENTTKATEAQIKANEDYITQTQMRYGVEDVLLRNSLGKLATVTGSLTKAQEMQAIALDVSAGAGISLESATTLVTKALQGSFTAFKKLGIELDANTIKNKNGAKAVEILGKTYEGAATAAAETTQGKLRRLNQAFEEITEEVGVALLPELLKLSTWATSPDGAKDIETTMQAITAAIKGMAAAMSEAVAIAGRFSQFWNDIQFTPENIFNTDPVMYDPRHPGFGMLRGYYNSPNTSSGYDTTRGAPINITVTGAIDPVSTARQIKKLLNSTDRLNVSPDEGKRAK
jgi:hypothetical protein